MAKEDIKLSIGQIRKMKHAIGLKETSPIRHGVYEAYRNCYDNGDYPNEEWDELVKLGLAIRRKYTIFDSVVYHVTKKGFEYLSELLGITIQEESNK